MKTIIADIKLKGEKTMKRLIKKAATIFVVVMLFLNCCVVGAFAEAQGWYAVRNKEHKQPKLDAAQEIIEKYGGYYVDKRYSDNDEEKVVYLTFDAGYENGNIEKILDALKAENVTAAFFPSPMKNMTVWRKSSGYKGRSSWNPISILTKTCS